MISFRVNVELPANVSPEEMKEYIASSVKSMKGCLDPKDPIFKLDTDSVHVVRYYKLQNETPEPVPEWML